MRHLRLKAVRAISFFLFIISINILFFVALPTNAFADNPEIWISPPEDVTQHGRDFHEFFLHPDQWHKTARIIRRFSVAVRYLLVTPPDTVTKELRVLHDLGIRLDVVVPALPVDKRICGNGIEGTTWPNEPTSYSRRLKALGVDVYSFSLDLPLTSGYRTNGTQSCHFSIRETAERTARATADILTIYPNAKIIDIEVPTGMPSTKWSSSLGEWLSDYRHASGRDFDGFMMDAWWQSDWRGAALTTVRVLGKHQIPAGIGLDASGFNRVDPASWIAAAKKNACELTAAAIPLSFVGVSNFQNMEVHGLPETNTATLTGLVVWLARHHQC